MILSEWKRIWNISRDFKKFQKSPENFERLWRIFKDYKKIFKNPKESKRVQKIQKNSVALKIVKSFKLK